MKKMKKITLLALSLIVTLTSFAQVTFENNDGDTSVTGANSVGCPSGDNNWGRLFTLSEFTVPADLGLLSGQIGIQSLNGGDVVVNIYSSPVVFDSVALVLLGTQIVTVPAEFVAPGTFDFDFDTAILVPVDTEALFMEITDIGDAVFIGGTVGNTVGKESWLKSATCSTPEYVTASSIAFPDAHFFLTLTGDTVLGTNDNEISNFSIYPNPTNGNLVNINTSIQGKMQVSVFDVLGKEIINTEISNNELNISSLDSGIYMVRVNQNGVTATKKLIKN